MQAQGLKPLARATVESAVPSFTHMAILALQKNFDAVVVSTNVDGLHMRSGIPKSHLIELHGNCFKETCSNPNCGEVYLRDFDCTKEGARKDHLTGRTCDKCNSFVYDSIIHFGENLPQDELERAFQLSNSADVAIVLGTSMRVAPACHLPINAKKNNSASVVIVNRQVINFLTKTFSKTNQKQI